MYDDSVIRKCNSVQEVKIFKVLNLKKSTSDINKWDHREGRGKKKEMADR